MEQILGVAYDASKYKIHEAWVQSRIQTVEADLLDQVEGDDQARARYQRMFWEPVVEGQVRVSKALVSTSFPISSRHQEPVLPAALKKAREDAKRHGRSEESSKSDATAFDIPYDSGRDVTGTSGAPIGRPSIMFIDVGDKFVDPKDRMRRMKESERRAKVRSKRVPKRHFVTAQ
jgi:hypothetical protein